MKKLFKRSALCLTALLMLCAAACSSGKAPDESVRADAPPSEVTDVSLSIAGTDIAQYKIVYATNPYGRAGRDFTTEYDFYKLIARHISEEIAAQTGITLSIAQDSQTDVSDHEILVGPTNRPESAALEGLNVYTYLNKLSGSKLIVGGGYDSTVYTGRLKQSYCFASTYHAWDYVKNYIATQMSSGQSVVDLTEGFELSGTCSLTTVACIGDSITEGYLSSNWDYNAYPAVLQRILWQDYLVINYGNSGRTMRSDLDNRYSGTAQYNACIRYAPKFDIALIMLGTNDSYFDRIWTDDDDQAYNDSALALAAALTKQNNSLQLVIMNCPVYYGNEGSGSLHVRNLQAGLVSLLTEQGYRTDFYNMHDYTEQKLGSNHFPDALHPDDEGYVLIAEGLAEMIPDCLAGTWKSEPEFIEEKTTDGEIPEVPIAEGAVNLLGEALNELYSINGSQYAGWWMDGTPYIYMDANVLSGSTITNIEVPVSSCAQGNKLTVSVVKYAHPTITEILKTYELTVDFSAGTGWIMLGGLNIEVPEGYTVAFGAKNDTLPMLYITAPTAGYSFYVAGAGSINTNDTLAFNLYGIKSN